jgi:chitodextrinase
VPSLAKFVHLTSTPADLPPDGRITNPKRDLVINQGDTVNFSGGAKDLDGTVTSYSWIFPGGSPGKVTMQNPGPVTFTEAGTQVISMTAFDNQGVNDPSPPTRTITVQPTAQPNSPPNE